MASQQGDDGSDPLEITSSDPESLFRALTAVENAVPDLLLSLKPILSGLISPDDNNEKSGTLAREGIDTYLTLLDKIQYVLRQTVYYLRETRASPHALRPPPVDAIPAPFASTLPSTDGDGAGEAELGLYASRLEARKLSEMADTIKAIRGELGQSRGEELEGDSLM